jgi:hypothetical protein
LGLARKVTGRSSAGSFTNTKELEIRRAYFSAFSPQVGTAFASKEPQPRWRERRLYQMDWLYRVYQFHPQEIDHAFDEAGNLSNSVYYRSQYSPERRNISAFHRRMPKTALASADMDVEQNKNGLTLDDFFGSDYVSNSR